jgi:hypothetical protein
MLSREYREFEGAPDVYDKQRGRSRSEEKSLIMRIIRDAGAEGTSRKALVDAIGRSSSHVGRLLAELKEEGSADLHGRGAGARWRAPDKAAD